jgi:hypothetical protein
MHQEVFYFSENCHAIINVFFLDYLDLKHFQVNKDLKGNQYLRKSCLISVIIGGGSGAACNLGY